jgi:DNA modification methylase
MVFTDPPYNVPIAGHVSGLGKVHHQDFVMATGELTPSAFVAFLRVFLGYSAAHSADGAIFFVFMDWRHSFELQLAARDAGLEFKNLCVWAKDNAGMGSFYRSQHELVFVLKAGSAPHINNFGLGKDGRYRTNVWTYPGVNSFRRERDAELAMHPTVKPHALVADAIKDCSRRKGLILDPFAGSGTTIIAAEKTGRFARAMELDPRYVDVIVKRWQTWAGEPAHLAKTGQTFDEVALARERRTAGLAVQIAASTDDRAHHRQSPAKRSRHQPQEN